MNITEGVPVRAAAETTALSEASRTASAEFTIQNVNGVAELKVALDGPGVYVARGANGAGKTSAIEALKAASGDKSAKAEPRDGTREGTVRMRGGVLLSVGAKRKTNGHPAVSLVSAGALGTLIDPGLKDPELAARARLKALLTLLPMPAGEESLKELTAGSDVLWSEFSVWIAKDGRAIDALELAEMVRRRANDLALAAEKEATVAEGTVNELGQLIAGLGQVDLNAGPLAQAMRAEQEAEARAAGLHIAAKAREDLEQRQAAIRRTLGKRPDSAGPKAEVGSIQKDITLLESRLGVLRSQLQRAMQHLVEAEEAEKLYDAQSEILRRPVEGPTRGEAEQAKQEAEKCRARTARSRIFEQAMTYRARMELSEETQANARESAKRLRAIAQGTGAALGRLLEKSGVPGLRIRDGRLLSQRSNPDGGPDIERDFDTRLSFGQRVRVALEVALAGIDAPAGTLPVLPLEPGFWLALDPERKREVNAIARERGVCLITEEPSEGELRIEALA